MEDLEGLELYQLMSLIEPVTEPAPVSLLPQTIGWLYLLCLTLVLISVSLWRKHRRKQKMRHRLLAVSLINQLEDDYTALTISSILKRCAMYDFARADIAPLSGESWAAFLNQRFSSKEQFKDFYSYSDNELLPLKVLAIRWLMEYKVAP